MKAMHFGVVHAGDPATLTNDFALPKGVVCHGDSFLVWGEHRLDDRPEGDLTVHLLREYRVSDLPDPEKAAYRPHLLTANGPVRGWLKSQGVYDRERLEIARLREEIAAVLPACCRLVDYVVVSDAEDWSEAQHVWTLDGIMSRSGS